VIFFEIRRQRRFSQSFDLSYLLRLVVLATFFVMNGKLKTGKNIKSDGNSVNSFLFHIE
jgi:hypothetical protein